MDKRRIYQYSLHIKISSFSPVTEFEVARPNSEFKLNKVNFSLD